MCLRRLSGVRPFQTTANEGAATNKVPFARIISDVTKRYLMEDTRLINRIREGRR